MTRPAVPHRGTSALWTLLVPAALGLGALAWALSVRGRLPEPLAVHWGTSGPDRAGDLTEALLVPLGLVLPPVAVLMSLVAMLVGHAALTRRVAAGVATGTAGMVAAVTVTTLAVQLDVPSWQQAGDVGTGLAVSFLLGAALGVLAARLSPGDAPQPATGAVPADAPRLGLGTEEAAVWTRTVRQAGLLPLGLLLAASVTLLAVLTRSVLPALALAALLAAPLLTLTSWRITVDRSGIAVVSTLGRPRIHVPLEEVEEATAREVDPLREFGGWGLRTAVDGTVGVVLRRGGALEVRRTGGRRLVVTVDDAATACALLNELADRTRRP